MPAYPVDPEVRFWLKVETRSLNECWPWLGALNGNGYGTFYVGRDNPSEPRKWAIAHRFAWESMNKQKIPHGLFACHTCDNTWCVNPNHIFLGTALDNMHDMLNKGRNGQTGPASENAPHGKLTKEQVLEIRRLHARENMRGSVIARMFNVSHASISCILLRKVWRTI